MDYINYDGKTYPVLQTEYGLVGNETLNGILVMDMEKEKEDAFLCDELFVFFVPNGMMERYDKQEITDYVKKECEF